jgi:hypothetical protein
MNSDVPPLTKDVGGWMSLGVSFRVEATHSEEAVGLGEFLAVAGDGYLLAGHGTQ